MPADETRINEGAPKSYDIVPVTDAEQIKRFLNSGDAEKIVEQILREMSDIVPLEISLQRISDILHMLKDNSSIFNKLWIVDNKVVGFLVCEEFAHYDGPNLYIKYFGIKKDHNHKVPTDLIIGNIDKLIKKAKQAKIKKISLHGFNKALNFLLKRRYRFQEDESQDLPFQSLSGSESVSYLYLDLAEEDQLSRSSVKEKKTKEIDLTELKMALSARIEGISEQEFKIISNKVLLFLRNTNASSPPNGWASLADAITENFRKLIETDMGVAAAIERHISGRTEIQRKLREDLAINPATPPELMVENEKLKLMRLNSEAQLKQESSIMKHCVGESDHYIKKIIAGESEIWSVRDKSGQILITIEYDCKAHAILQMKKRADSLLNGKERWSKDFFHLLSLLDKLDPPIIISSFKDIGEIDLESNEVISVSGNKLKPGALAQSKEKVIIGTVMVDDSMSQETLEGLFKVEGLTLDLTNLNQDKKNKIESIAGNFGDFSGSTQYHSLKFVGGDFDSTSKKIELPNLIEVKKDFRIYDAEVVDLPKLKKTRVFSISCKELTSPELELVGGNFEAEDVRLISLPKLKRVVGDFLVSSAEEVFIPNTEIFGGSFTANHLESLDLPKASVFGGNLNVENATSIKLPLAKRFKILWSTKCKNIDLPSAISFDGDLYTIGVEVLSLPNLKSIDGDIVCPFATKIDLKNLTILNGTLKADKITDLSLPKLKKIGAISADSIKKVDFPELEIIGGNTSNYSENPSFFMTNVLTINAPKLKIINCRFDCWSLESVFFPELVAVKGDFNVDGSFSVSLPNLTNIDGTLLANSAKNLFLPKLEDVSGSFCAKSAILIDLPAFISCHGNFVAHSAISVSCPNAISFHSFRVDNAEILNVPLAKSFNGEFFAPKAKEVNIGVGYIENGLLIKSAVGDQNTQNIFKRTISKFFGQKS